MIKKIICSLGLMLCLISAPAMAQAGIFGGAECSKAPDTAVCKDKNSGNPLTGNDGLLVRIANIVAFVAGVGAVAMLIYGGINLMTANGDASNVASARTMVLNALIGVAIIFLARTLILFVLDKL